MSDKTLESFCRAIALMPALKMVEFESYSCLRPLAPINALRSARTQLTVIYGMYEYARFHEQLAVISDTPLGVNEKSSLVIQFGL